MNPGRTLKRIAGRVLIITGLLLALTQLTACPRPKLHPRLLGLLGRLNEVFKKHDRHRVRVNALMQKARRRGRAAFQEILKFNLLPMVRALRQNLMELDLPFLETRPPLGHFLTALIAFEQGIERATIAPTRDKPERMVMALISTLKQQVETFRERMQALEAHYRGR